MSCNKLIKPELTPQQIAECKQCIHASKEKIWCGKFGFYFVQPEKKILQPSKKLFLPNQKIRQPRQGPCLKPPLSEMIKNFTTAMVRWAKSGLKTVNQETYIKRLSICSDCTKCRTCPKCGCILKAKAALATEKCPDEKW